MKVDIRFRGIDKSEALEEHIKKRATMALRPFLKWVREVIVRLEDLNGPKGGVDKRCLVEISGGFGTRVIEARDVDFYTASSRAIQQSSRSIQRIIQRQSEY